MNSLIVLNLYTINLKCSNNIARLEVYHTCFSSVDINPHRFKAKFFRKVDETEEEYNDHIMVLDHTRDGYEWTFSNNDTKKVAGGWDEIVAKYKELIPYRDLLVNKKLDNVEREEIKTIDDFINDPSIKKFTKILHAFSSIAFSSTDMTN